MSDIVDHAEAHIQRERDAAIAAVLAAVPVVAEPMHDRRCEECGGWIGLDRLRAVPHSGQCFECARARESRRKTGVRQ